MQLVREVHADNLASSQVDQPDAKAKAEHPGTGTACMPCLHASTSHTLNVITLCTHLHRVVVRSSAALAGTANESIAWCRAHDIFSTLPQ